MRTQDSKNLPKKGFSSKSSLKPPIKAAKKKNVSPKKVSQPLKRSLNKVAKKKSKKNVGAKSGKEDKTPSDTDHLEASTPTSSRSQSPGKKVKKEKKKTSLKSTAALKSDNRKKIEAKINMKTLLKVAVKRKNKHDPVVKYKINTNCVKKNARPLKNTKFASRKGTLVPQKEKRSKKITNIKISQTSSTVQNSLSSEINSLGSDPDLYEARSQHIEGSANTAAHNLVPLETNRTDVERTPKFFTSSRTPRTLDIDVQSFKTAKRAGISKKITSQKCPDQKSGESPNLVTQGPDMDVYTFTEKVDSPKNILPDFRDVSTKNVGKVRPIARVKGTVIDKKQDTEKKKFLPHRPIEEVVKQPKTNKNTDDPKSQPQKLSQHIEAIPVKKYAISTNETDIKAIVSKSYKMVARKTRIPGNPLSSIKFLGQKEAKKASKCKNAIFKKNTKLKIAPEDELETSKFSLNKDGVEIFFSEESASESNEDNDVKDSSGSEKYKFKKSRTQSTKKGLVGSSKIMVSRELRELAKCAGSTLKDNSKKNKVTLLSMWTGPKIHRMASLNAIAKVHCLYENETRTHMELGLMKTIDRQIIGSIKSPNHKKKHSNTNEKNVKENSSESEFEKKEKSEESSGEESIKNTRTLRGEPGLRSAGKYWDPRFSTSSSEDSELESIRKVAAFEKKRIKNKPVANKSDPENPTKKAKKTEGVPVKKKRYRNEVVMDFKDMVVQKRMASLNARAILAASYEKRFPKSSKDETTSDSCSNESFSLNSINRIGSGVKSELKNEQTQNYSASSPVSDQKQKLEVIVNQDTDVTIRGVYSTHHHDGFCTVSGMQYRISSTSHTQTTATSNCEKESSRDDESRCTPWSTLSSTKPPADKPTPHSGDLGGLSRRPGCSSAFSAPATAVHYEPGYYQPAGPLIKEASADGADRTLARYHPPLSHYHPPHPPVLQQYGPSYYPSELCYGQYYRPAGPYHMRPLQPSDAPMVGVPPEPYPPPQYYGGPPCYQHAPQRLPYIEYRGCPCPMNSYPKNVVIGPATGNAPTGGGPGLSNSGTAFGPKARAARVHSIADNHAAGKDLHLEGEPPPAADAPRPCPLPLSLGGASPKRELFEERAARRLAGESAGPPSPARGSAGASVPQPPPAAGPPRRARLGKEAARRHLAPGDTALRSPPPDASPGTSPDVLALSPPPRPPPIDLSSDERSTLLIDVKKENEGPVHPAHRKNEAQALREHNSSTTNDKVPESPVKRRYSKPQLHIDMIEVTLEDACKTNCIGEHVKLQKRRKISTEHIEINEPKKQVTPKAKKTPKVAEAKATKRKLLDTIDDLHLKRLCAENNIMIDRLAEVDAPEMHKKPAIPRPRNKSALLLDNLIRKNSIDSNSVSIEKSINPAELFLPKRLSIQSAAKPSLNINNNEIENQSQVNNLESSPVKLKKSPRKSVSPRYLHDKHRRKKDSEELGAKLDGGSCPNTSIAETLSRVLPVSDEIVSPLRISLKKYEKPLKSKKYMICDIEKVDIETNKELRVTDIVESNCIATCLTKEIVKELNGQLDQLPRSKFEGTSNGEVKLKCVEKVCEKAKLLVSKKRHDKELEEVEFVEAEEARSPCLIVKPRKGRRHGSGRKPRRLTCIPPHITDARAPPRWSNGWRWDGDHYFAKVYLNNNSRLDRTARCWSRMRHASGDLVARGDCVLLRASSARAQPFVARVAKLWENPEDGEMMVSLVWYYRPEHTEQGRSPQDAPDEVFASRHRDANSVACIEDKCFVLTYNEYCRYRKRLKALEEGVNIPPSIVPPLSSAEVAPAVATNDAKLPPSVSPELVLFCRKIYDFRSKKLQVPTK